MSDESFDWVEENPNNYIPNELPEEEEVVETRKSARDFLKKKIEKQLVDGSPAYKQGYAEGKFTGIREGKAIGFKQGYEKAFKDMGLALHENG